MLVTVLQKEKAPVVLQLWGGYALKYLQQNRLSTSKRKLVSQRTGMKEPAGSAPGTERTQRRRGTEEGEPGKLLTHSITTIGLADY
jgi:hypothetical protein